MIFDCVCSGLILCGLITLSPLSLYYYGQHMESSDFVSFFFMLVLIAMVEDKLCRPDRTSSK